MERRPLVIIGSGPAGSASALFLHRHDPRLAAEALVLERERHPRFKVCAGGLIPHTLDCLRELDVPLGVPNAIVHHARVEVPGKVVAYDGHELCRVVRRNEFDHALVDACRARGVEVREGEKVVALRRESDGVRIETEQASYHAEVVIGADGSGSVVRRHLLPGGREHIGKAIMCDVPTDACQWPGFEEQRYDFSFAAVPDGLRGYAWVFPCFIGGRSHANIGVYSLETAGVGVHLQTVLAKTRRAWQVAEDVPVKSFPIRWYSRDTAVTAPRVLLAGDAAGVDPLMGEGISFAFEYGRRAAMAAARAVATKDFAFDDYARQVHLSWLGKKLRRLEMGTRLFYGPTWRLWFTIAARSRQAREIGLRWYNGVDGWDRRSGWEALGAWWRGAVQPAPSAGRPS